MFPVISAALLPAGSILSHFRFVAQRFLWLLLMSALMHQELSGILNFCIYMCTLTVRLLVCDIR